MEIINKFITECRSNDETLRLVICNYIQGRYYNFKTNYSCEYRDNLKHGTLYKYNTDGTSTVTNYLYNDVNGLCISYYSNGKKQNSMNFHNNARHGPAITWYPDGQLHSTYNYVNDFIHGDAIWYHPNGTIQRIERCNMGLHRDIHTEYDTNGNLVDKKEYYSTPSIKYRVSKYPSGCIKHITMNFAESDNCIADKLVEHYNAFLAK